MTRAGPGTMLSVPVELGERRYEVVVGNGALGCLRQMVPRGARRAAVVTQAQVARHVDPRGVDAGVPVEVIEIPDGEGAKSMATLERLCSALARAGITRGDVIVAIGGGVVTDVAGFAAASFHRGMRYVNVATTLLAQVDAAIGGKTGVNLPEGKNLVGAFWQPSGVICDTALLSSLPEREWASGRGEMAKYAFLGEASIGEGILELPVEEQVARCAALKAGVVCADEREGGQRVVLNYGHTLAHAIEAVSLASGGDIRHGEAVAVGLVFAAELAARLGRIDTRRVEVHRRVVSGFGLGTSLPVGYDAAELVEYMERDKKASGDLTFVLDGPHGVERVGGVPLDAVHEALEAVRDHATIPEPR